MKRNKLLAVLLMTLYLSISSWAQQTKKTTEHMQKYISLKIDVKAPIDEVWKKWTTVEGAESFWGPRCVIELEPMGKLEVHWYPNSTPGQRGAENVNILAVQENKLLSFTWDAHWDLHPNVRKHRTDVIIRFAEIDKNNTRITFAHFGWGEGEEWDKAYEFFRVGWGETVLPYLKYSLEVGPIDWNNRPDKQVLTPALTVKLD